MLSCTVGSLIEVPFLPFYTFFMLDFMGEKSKETADDSIDAEVVKLASDFVVSQHQKYVNDENEKLASRYFRLLNYINSRKKLWGVE